MNNEDEILIILNLLWSQWKKGEDNIQISKDLETYLSSESFNQKLINQIS